MDQFSRGHKIAAMAMVLSGNENDMNLINVSTCVNHNQFVHHTQEIQSGNTSLNNNVDKYTVVTEMSQEDLKLYLDMQLLTNTYSEVTLEVLDLLKLEFNINFESQENGESGVDVSGIDINNSLDNIDINALEVVDENLIPLNAYCDDNEADNEEIENDDMYKVKRDVTKKGEKRKRRLFVKSQKERKTLLDNKRKAMHRVKPPCRHCRIKCMEKFNEEDRKEINNQFWHLKFSERKLYIINHIEQMYIKKRRKENIDKENHAKTKSFIYRLKNKFGNLEQVCKKFFLATLGYAQSNDSILKPIYKRCNDGQLSTVTSTTSTKKKRKGTQIDRELIKNHIKQYCPTISHYRREHAPQRLYLPSDIKIIDMYNDFKEKNPRVNCSYELYRNVVSNDMNIAFTKLGHEKCEKCEIFDLHRKRQHGEESECDDCSSWKKHKLMAKTAREAYQLDVAEAADKDGTVMVSADMQKIIMIPRLEMFKQVVFCPRVIVFNETFVPIGKLNKKDKVGPFAAVWHEAISGRKKEDVVSAFHAFLLHVRDYQEIIIWLDNCTGQNKNWCLLSFLVYIINSNAIAADMITFKYFEPGHTFMSADSFHHLIENGLRKHSKVYDFQDFMDVVKNCSSKNVTVKEMQVKDFRQWPDLSSNYQLNKNLINSERPALKDICILQARRGHKSLFYKTSHNSNEEYKNLNFLSKKHMKNNLDIPQSNNIARGISEERKENIIKKLGPLMPPHKLKFWKDLSVFENNSESE